MKIQLEIELVEQVEKNPNFYSDTCYGCEFYNSSIDCPDVECDDKICKYVDNSIKVV